MRLVEELWMSIRGLVRLSIELVRCARARPGMSSNITCKERKATQSEHKDLSKDMSVSFMLCMNKL